MVTSVSKKTTNVRSRTRDQTCTDLILGTEFDAASGQTKELSFPTNSLKTHALVCGNTGAGKTNTCFNLLEQLWSQRIPFMVIEPTKSEYRHLMMNSADLKDDARVYTLGDESLAQFRLNPFEIFKGVNVQNHIDSVVSLFNASFEMYSPMPQVLYKAIVRIYENRGWDLLQNKNWRLPPGIEPGYRECPNSIFPNMKDLLESIHPTLEAFGYSERIGPDVKAALLARLGGLIVGAKERAFSRRNTVGAQALFEKPCVVEFHDTFSGCEKSFLSGVMLLLLYERRKGLGLSGDLEHVLLIEEGQRLLLAEASKKDPGYSNLPVTEIFSNFLSESGSGQGIIISAQSPDKLMPSVLSNTNLKIVHRLVSESEINSVAPVGVLDCADRRRLFQLLAGESIILSPLLGKRQTVTTKNNLNLRKGQKLTRSVSDDRVRKFMEKSRTGSMNLFDCITADDLVECNEALLLMALAGQVADNENFRNVFSSFVLAVLYDITQIVHYRVEIIQSAQQIIGRRPESDERLRKVIWIVLVLSADRYLEQKSAEHYWSLNELEEQRTRFVGLLKTAFISTTDRMDSKPINEWRDKFNEAQNREQGPYSTCALCTSKCQYRTEVSEALRDEKLKNDFSNSINRDNSSASTEAAAFSKTYAHKMIGQNNMDLAFCLSVHFIKEQQLSAATQLILLSKIRCALEEDANSVADLDGNE